MALMDADTLEFLTRFGANADAIAFATALLNPSVPPVVTPPTPTPTPSQNATTFTISEDKNPYPIEDIYPGQSKIIQIFNPDGIAYSFPTGTTIAGRCINVLGRVIADLTPTFADMTKGMVKITLPDNERVRFWADEENLWDLYFQVPFNGVMLRKFLPESTFEINSSGSLWDSVLAPIAPSTTPSPSSNPTAPGAPAPEIIKIYVKDSVRYGSDGKLYQEELVITPDGKGTLRYTEIKA